MSKYAMGYTGGGASGASGFTPFASGYKASSGELFGLYGGLFGDLTSALGASGQAKMAKLNAQMQYAHDNYMSERNYLTDLYSAKLSHQRSVQEAQMLSLQGQAQQAALAYQEAMSEINAQRERLNLQGQADMARASGNSALLAKASARYAGDHEAARYGLQAGNAQATQRAALAANNVVMSEGSAQELQASADMMRALDLQTIRNNAINEAFGHEARANDLFSQAAMAEANKHSVRGQYFGSAGVRTEFTPQADMSQYVTRTPTYNQASFIRPGVTLATSLLGTANNFAQRWDSIYNKKAL